METSSPGLQAIQTVYDNHYFRSRLEARWAVFFKSLSIPYHYEPEGFNLHGLYYLPDFYLPDQQFFFEVKGPFTDNKGPEKAAALAEASGRRVFLFGEIPLIERHRGFNDSQTGQVFYSHEHDSGYMWCRKSCCGKYGIEYHGRSGRIICDCPQRDTEDWEVTYFHPALLLAYTSARHHRFDGGAK